MYLFLSLTVLGINLHCPEAVIVHKNACKESAWICQQMDQMQQMIAALQVKTAEQERRLAEMEHRLKEQASELERREEGRQIEPPLQADAKGSQRRRADDLGPLEPVVLQLGQQLAAVLADVQALKASDLNQTQFLRDASGSVFVRWGSAQCPSASQLVYAGVVGGAHYTQPGAATNYLCLTMNPVPSDHTLPPGMAYLYGAEYETWDAAMEKDAVCAVCRSSYAATVMIPGTNVCSPGWTAQYSGFLMAGEHDHAAGSEFICVDSALDSRVASNADQNGKLLYFAVTACGSLPCGPYVDSKLVTCVVCSR